jgi:hypothetical protein
MVPFQSKLRFPDAFLRKQTLQIIPLINVGAPDMLDLARTDDILSRLMTTLCEISNVRDCSMLVSVTLHGKNPARNIPYMRKISISGF